MNFDDAIRAHLKWKTRLRVYLTSLGSARLDADLIGNEEECDLGRWILGQGVDHRGLPEYETLKLHHAAFHRVAADIVKTAQADKAAALGLLDDEATFSVLSEQVVATITALKAKLASL